MAKYWICLLLLSLAAVSAQQGDESYEYYDDAPSLFDVEDKEIDSKKDDKQASPDEQEWKKEVWKDYEEYSLYDSPSLFDIEGKNLDDDKKEENLSSEDQNKENFDQIEDNRSELNADEDNEENGTNVDKGFAKYSEENFSPNIENPKEKSESDEEIVDADLQKENDNVEVEAEEKESNGGEDSSVYMDEESDPLDVPVKKETVNSEEEKEIKTLIEDVKESAAEENDDNDDEILDKYAEEAADDILESSRGNSIEGDTVDKVMADLDKNLDKLMETWKKLSDDNGDEVEPEKNADDTMDPDQISKYEDKYGVPYGEKYVLSLREQNYDDADGADNEEKMSDEVDDSDEEIVEIPEKNKDSVDLDNQNNDDGLFKDDPEADEATSEEFGSNEGDDNADAALNVDSSGSNDTFSVVFDKDILSDDGSDVANELAKDVEEQNKLETPTTETAEVSATIDVSQLNSEQYDQLMEQFKKEHADSFDLSKMDVGRNVAPIHITLTQEPLTVTSPNFPSPYPTNNIIDWVFTGEGVGIELIITDFYVNGIMGDYLLVVPGGIDDSSKEGLVFSHMLNEPRKYRFLDVDKMFVRFQSMPGFAFRQGFSFTVRMVSPLPGEEDQPDETLPEPEALQPVPVETFTVLIGGLTLPQFNESLEQFRHLIADMATVYINSNDIDPGLNTTLEVTQITKVAVCNLNWPNSDVCSEVTFAVPLVYEEDEDDDDDEENQPRLSEGELRAMWYLYSVQDPFALRLRNMGMEEFASPNDSGVLTVWLAIGFGLLISMAMLAFALWRFSCFENYARMPTYSDRDSVYSKQGLDLYPTPHQTLPPLFSENEYKWDDGKFEDSSRVDMGGFSNKSYIRDELLDIESDEDVITPNKRDSGYQPRGFEV